MRTEIVQRLPVKVAYLRYTGIPGEPIGRYWRATVVPWLADNGLLDCPRYGVAVGRDAASPGEYRYDACVALPPGLRVPDASETEIPGGRYAVTWFKGTSAEIGAAWDTFVDATLADPAHRADPSRRAFEHYPRGAAFDSRTGIFSCELCFPLLDQPTPATGA